jgi:hypothetical protein
VKAFKDPEDPCKSAEPITGSLVKPWRWFMAGNSKYKWWNNWLFLWDSLHKWVDLVLINGKDHSCMKLGLPLYNV